MNRRLLPSALLGCLVALLALGNSVFPDVADTRTWQRRTAATGSQDPGAADPSDPTGGGGTARSGGRSGGPGGGRGGAVDGERLPTPQEVRADPLYPATLTPRDVGDGWREFDLSQIPPEDYIRIGGEVGVGNMPGTVERKVQTAYEERRGDGYVANSILLMGTQDEAEDGMAALRASAVITRWTQSFSDGDDNFELSDLPFETVGDDTFAVHLNVASAEPFPSTEEIDYVAFRIGRVLSFVFVSEADTAEMVRRSETKVRELLESDFR